MKNIISVCTALDVRLPQAHCENLNHAALGILGAAFLVALYAYAKFQHWQCRDMQRIRGSNRSGPAVNVKSKMGEEWVYTRYFRRNGRVYIAPRAGYDLKNVREDLDSLSDSLRLKQSQRLTVVDYNEDWLKFFGFRLVAMPDATLRSESSTQKRPKSARKLDFEIGGDELGAPARLSFADGAVGGIVGGSGSGKSVLLRRIVQKAQADLGFQVSVIDPHDLAKASDFAGAEVVGSSLDSWLAHYRKLDAELQTRLRVLQEKGVAKWTELSAAVMPALLTCVDECHALLSPGLSSRAQNASEEQKKFFELQQLIAKIAAQGRKAGLLQIFVGQSAYSADWSLSFTNFTLFKVAFALPSAALAQSFLGVETAADPSLRHGRFILADQNGIRRVMLK